MVNIVTAFYHNDNTYGNLIDTFTQTVVVLHGINMNINININISINVFMLKLSE